jgi:hypothetical protein
MKRCFSTITSPTKSSINAHFSPDIRHSIFYASLYFVARLAFGGNVCAVYGGLLNVCGRKIISRNNKSEKLNENSSRGKFKVSQRLSSVPSIPTCHSHLSPSANFARPEKMILFLFLSPFGHMSNADNDFFMTWKIVRFLFRGPPRYFTQICHGFLGRCVVHRRFSAVSEQIIDLLCK